MLNIYVAIAISAALLALGISMLWMPEKFLARRDEGLPPMADRNWLFRTESRVRFTGFFYVFLGGVLLLGLGTR